MHYHIITCVEWRYAIANAVFLDYTEALSAYVGLSNMLFAKAMPEPEQLSFENAVATTDYGSGEGAYVGNSTLGLVFGSCADECEWQDRTWN